MIPRLKWWGWPFAMVSPPRFARWRGADRREALSLFIGPIEIRWTGKAA